MRIMTVVSAAGLLAAICAFANVASAQDDPAYLPRPRSIPVYAGSTYFPYGQPWLPYHAYRSDVRFGYVPVAPPAKLFRPATSWYGCWFYGPPVYMFPRPSVACPGYAGFSGCDPNAYRGMVPPPIPTPSMCETNARPKAPTPAPESLPTPPASVSPASEVIPPPPSFPATK